MRTPRRSVARSRPRTLAVTLIGLSIAVTVVHRGTGTSSGRVVLVGFGGSGPQSFPVPATAAPADAGTGAAAALSSTFSIAGKVSGLYPGDSVPLVLTVTNPNKFGITVTSISTTVGNASSQCLAGNVTVTSFSGALTLSAGASGKVTVTVTMSHAAPDACQGRTFPVHYTGSAQGV